MYSMVLMARPTSVALLSGRGRGQGPGLAAVPPHAPVEFVPALHLADALQR